MIIAWVFLLSFMSGDILYLLYEHVVFPVWTQMLGSMNYMLIWVECTQKKSIGSS